MNVEQIDCPLCHSIEHKFWAEENGFDCVRCSDCNLLYVNPRPNSDYILESVSEGRHIFDDGRRLNTKAKRIQNKKRYSKKVIKKLFSESLDNSQISWLDVGAGYGEFTQALISLLPVGSVVVGIEPMNHKVNRAKELGLPVKKGFVGDVKENYDVVSIIDVFSHIPDFQSLLLDIKNVLNENGEILIKTGNAADINDRSQFPGPLNLPDHLVFGGIPQITSFLENAGFTIIDVHSERVDGIWYSLKNLIKYFLRKPVSLSLPYTSPIRTVWLRARLDG